MTPGARFNTIIALYDMVNATPKPADQVLHNYFRQHKYIGSKDRKFITEHVYLLFRHYARLNWWAQQMRMTPDGRMMVILWLAVANGQSVQEISTLFDGAGYAPDTLRRHERDIIDRVTNRDFMPPEMPEHVTAECPEWAYKSLKKAFGNDFARQMQALQEEAPLDLRINTLKSTDRDAVLKRLKNDGFDVAPTPFSPLGARVQGRPAFSQHPYYTNGTIEVQDEGSQILALSCGVKPGDWVVDFCAGAGGKTLALAAQMQNKGRIWACDVEQYRLENSRKRLRRAGVHCVETKLLQDEEDDWVKRHKGKADCVLIDAPCSGLGTWRRNPFVRWQNLGPNLKSLTALQQSILQSAARLVKSGGHLIYATCSMLPEENQQQVDEFVKNNPGFKAVPLETMWAAGGVSVPQGLDLSGSSLQMTPARHNTDGFFVSALVRL